MWVDEGGCRSHGKDADDSSDLSPSVFDVAGDRQLVRCPVRRQRARNGRSYIKRRWRSQVRCRSCIAGVEGSINVRRMTSKTREGRRSLYHSQPTDHALPSI